MLKYQIDEMKRTANRMLLRARPPRTVYLEQPHAEHLGVKFNRPKVTLDTPTRQPAEPEPGVVQMAPLVEVKFEDFVKQLKGAKGVDEQQPDDGTNQPDGDGTETGT